MIEAVQVGTAPTGDVFRLPDGKYEVRNAVETRPAKMGELWWAGIPMLPQCKCHEALPMICHLFDAWLAGNRTFVLEQLKKIGLPSYYARFAAQIALEMGTDFALQFISMVEKTESQFFAA